MKIQPTKPLLKLALLGLFALNAPLSTGFAQGTAFTDQGRLHDAGAPASGSYDFQFTLYGSASGGSALVAPLTNSAVAVSNGLFTATLNFGNQFPGSDRFLEIAVRTNLGGAGTFSTLAPRQPIAPVPYAITASQVVVGTNGLSAGSGLVAVGGFEKLRVIRGVVSSTGAILAGSGFTVTKGATGNFTLSFGPFLSMPTVVVTPQSGIDRSATCTLINVDSVGIWTRDSAGNAVDNQFNFFIIGPT